MSDIKTNIIDLGLWIDKKEKKKKERPGKPFFSKPIGPLLNSDTPLTVIVFCEKN